MPICVKKNLYVNVCEVDFINWQSIVKTYILRKSYSIDKILTNYYELIISLCSCHTSDIVINFEVEKRTTIDRKEIKTKIRSCAEKQLIWEIFKYTL